MDLALLVDFGSTFTKLVLVDLEGESLLATAQSPSTVTDNMMNGFNEALEKLLKAPEVVKRGIQPDRISRKLACSSAAGGLRLVAVGLVPQLTLEAARRAALGAGAKVVGSYSFSLTRDDVKAIEQKPCDIILLSGGTDGGNCDVVTHNARALAACSLDVPFVVAANRVAASDVAEILRSAGKEVEVTENVLPELDKINVEPARNEIRSAFVKRIVKAKGLDKAQEYLGGVLMPTPMATLKAAQLLADGTNDDKGLGELMVVEVGGATTNVHSVASGGPTRGHVMVKGLPEPYAKRTVEGDLGIRYNAATIVDIAGEDRIRRNTPGGDTLKPSEIRIRAEQLSANVGIVPETDMDFMIDVGLARVAVQIASERHAGTLTEIPTPMGTALVQYGKDLTDIKSIIATGGVFAHGRMPEVIVQGACFSPDQPLSLRPRGPCFMVDRSYVLFAMGLLSETTPTTALRIAKKSLGKCPA